VFGGRRGHPVLFARALFAELAAVTGDTGARNLLDRLDAGLALIEAPDDGVLFDVDTPATRSNYLESR
jgi:molybdenum cofactor cytidylyltransferase